MHYRDVRVKKSVIDPFRQAFIQAGLRLPLLFDLYLRLRHGPLDGPVYLIYSEGTAGTASLQYSMEKSGFRPTIHLHLLNPENIRSTYHYPPNVGLMYRKALLERKRRLYIISPVRNPVDRGVSRFFRELGKRGLVRTQAEVVELTRQFEEYWKNFEPDDWFSREMSPALGLDVYAHPFPLDKGWLAIEKENLRLLLLRVELENSVRERIVAGFLGAETFTWDSTVNSAQERGYADLYRVFRREAVLPEALLRKFSAVRYARHFYGEEELEKRIRYWLSVDGR